MSNIESQTVTTDSNEEQVNLSTVKPVEKDYTDLCEIDMRDIDEADTSNIVDASTELSVTPVTDTAIDPVTDSPVLSNTKVNYEVVFFVRYTNSPRPSAEELTNLFNTYGRVHHVNSPEDKNFAFVFMTSLSTTLEHRRTRSTISQIIQDMPMDKKFYITVAGSNRGQPQQQTRVNQNTDNRNVRYNNFTTNNANYQKSYFRNGEKTYNRKAYQNLESKPYNRFENKQAINTQSRPYVRNSSYNQQTDNQSRPYVRNSSYSRQSDTQSRPYVRSSSYNQQNDTQVRSQVRRPFVDEERTYPKRPTDEQKDNNSGTYVKNTGKKDYVRRQN